jgi:hypothetical protein
MKSISKLQIIDLKDERSDFERELTSEEAKKIVGGSGTFGINSDPHQNPRPWPCPDKGKKF